MNALRLLFAIAICGFAADERLVVPLPADSEIHVRKDIAYDGGLQFDLYAPAHHASPVPVVLFMNGVGGRSVRSWPQYTGWGKLVTGSGLAGVVYDSHEGGAARDTRALLQYLREHGSELGIDARNVILWACSANVTEGLPLAMDASNAAIKAAVIYYGTAPVKAVRLDLPVLMVSTVLD
jgi:hypothetical protein